MPSGQAFRSNKGQSLPPEHFACRRSRNQTECARLGRSNVRQRRESRQSQAPGPADVAAAETRLAGAIGCLRSSDSGRGGGRGDARGLPSAGAISRGPGGTPVPLPWKRSGRSNFLCLTACRASEWLNTYSPDRGIEYSLQRAVLPWGEARGRECIQGDTRPTEQRSPRAKRPLPEGLRRFWLVASLLVGSQSAAAMLPSSRLATSQNSQQQTVFYPAAR